MHRLDDLLNMVVDVRGDFRCQGTKQAETQALSVVDMTKSYPEKEIVLQDIADVQLLGSLTQN